MFIKRLRSSSVQLIACGAVALLASSSGCHQSMRIAAREGKVERVRRQLAWGVDPNWRSFRYRRAPLHEAAANGHVEVVQLLLDNDAEVNIKTEGSATPLHYASRGGHVDVMRVLLEAGANVAERGTGCGTPLQWAAADGHLKAAELLLEYQADINQEGGDGLTALHVAAGKGDLEMVTFLVSEGASVNAVAAYGRRPLHSAGGHAQVVKTLLDHGADVDAPYNGRTALHWAACRDDLDVAKLLLDHGADVTVVFFESTALDMAKSKKFSDLLRQCGGSKD